MNKTIVHLVDYGGVYSGNFITSLLRLNDRLTLNGMRLVVVFTEIAKDREWLSDLYDRDIPVYFVSKKKKRKEIINTIYRIIVKEDGQIIHTHFSSFDILSILLYIKLKIKRKKISVIWHVHSDFPNKKTTLKKVKKIIRYRIIGSVARVITVSEKLKEELLEVGYPNDRVQTILNGIDVKRAIDIRRGRLEVRKDLGISDNSIVLLAFGWHPEVKGVDLLIEAMNLLKHKVENDVVLVLVGEQMLRNYINSYYDNSFPDWLRVIPPTENISDLYNAADVFVSASRGEGFSYSVGEAMANKLPIISSDIPGLKWAHGTSGVLFFENNNYNALSEKIKVITNLTKEERISFGEPNLEFIGENFGIDNWVENMMIYYRELI